MAKTLTPKRWKALSDLLCFYYTNADTGNEEFHAAYKETIETLEEFLK
jgi:hypothetical protein